MARRLLTLQSRSAGLDTLTRLLDRYSGELGEAGVAAYTETLNEYKFEMRNRAEFGPLFKQTGRLRSSFDMEVTGGARTLKGLRGSLYSKSGYSIIHEEGGVITPSTSRSWIFIPTIWNLKANRTAKVTPSQAIANGARYMSYKNVDQAHLTAMAFVSTQLLVDAAGFPVFCLVKSAKYKAQLGTQVREPLYSLRIQRRLADKAMIPFQE